MVAFTLPLLRVFYQGQVASGAKVYVYETGSTTPVAVFSDADLGTPATNPLTANSNGEVVFFIGATTAIRLDLYTSSGTFIETIDPVYPAANYTSGGSAAEAAIVAASTTDLGSTGSNIVAISGSTTITAFGNSASTASPIYNCRLTGAPLLTHNATSLILPGGQNIQGANGDAFVAEYLGSGNWKVLFYQAAATSPVQTTPNVPQGRLTLVSATPIMNSDQTAKTTVYYTPYIGNSIPIYNGSLFANTAFSEVSLALDSNSGHTGYQQSGKNFDLFVYSDSGTLRLGTGPAWSSDTSRGTGAGTTELQQLKGIWTNKNAITLRFGSASGNTSSVAANQATYVGTMRATADGQTGMAFKPAATGGGTNNILGLYNAYNRVRTTSMSRDSTASWSYATATWRASNNNNSNRISFVDGLQQSFVVARFQDAALPSANASPGIIGVNLNSTSATPNIVLPIGNTGGTTDVDGKPVTESFAPQLGFNYVQAMEFAVGGSSSTFYGTNYSQQIHGLSVELEM